MRRVAIVAVAGVVLALLAACAAVPPAAPAAGVTVENPFARSSPMEGGTAGAFFTVRNGGPIADRLTAAAFAGAEAVELHETVDEGGVMKMRPHPEGWEVPAGGQLELKPGGKHVMLIGLKEPLKPGTEIEITLTFEKAGVVRVKAPVREAGAM
jgi:periplasmic copper chaperone A